MKPGTPNLFGLVLAGGHSRRMGRDKGSMPWDGRSLVDRAYALLLPRCARVFVSCRREQQDLPGYRDKPMLPDRREAPGPLGALLDAMETQPRAAWLVVACDLPLLDDITLDRVIEARSPDRIVCAYANPRNGLPEPLCAVYEPTAFAPLRDLAAQGVRCPRQALIRMAVPLLVLPHPHALDNMNEPGDYARMRKDASDPT